MPIREVTDKFSLVSPPMMIIRASGRRILEKGSNCNLPYFAIKEFSPSKVQIPIIYTTNLSPLCPKGSVVKYYGCMIGLKLLLSYFLYVMSLLSRPTYYSVWLYLSLRAYKANPK